VSRAHTPPALDTPSLHDALPICPRHPKTPNGKPSTKHTLQRNEKRKTSSPCRHHPGFVDPEVPKLDRDYVCPEQERTHNRPDHRSEEHTSELQSRFDLVCRLLLE